MLTIVFDKKRNYGLDILRALAIFFVMNIHSVHFFDPDSTLFKALTIWNLDGVTLFFVLSGFLIGGILITMFEKGELTFKTLFNFWIRRWFRTLPNYFLILTILLCIGLHFKTVTNFSQVSNYYYFLANFKEPMPEYLFPEAWSLSVEEWFYLLIPVFIFILVVVCRFKPKFSILAVALIIIAFSTGFRYHRFSRWPGLTQDLVDVNFRKQVVTRLDSIMFGVLGAYLAYYHLALWKKYKKALFFIGIILLYFDYKPYILGGYGLYYGVVFSFSVQSLGFLCLFPYVTELKSGKGFIYRCITRFSIISYSVYLLNYSIVKFYTLSFLNNHVFKNIDSHYLATIDYFCFWFVTIIGATLLYKYFEKPFMALRDLV
jgi:peptidoglycan/LPS O-acetylase OafA/YrhL